MTDKLHSKLARFAYQLDWSYSSDTKRQPAADVCTPTVQISEEQEAVLKMVMAGQSVFFTGSAGTGKSYLLREIIRQLRKKGRTVAVTASTGIAAISLEGRTLHSWTGVGLGLEDAHTLGKKIVGYPLVLPGGKKIWKQGNRLTHRRWKETDVLVVDEISMVDGRFFDKLEKVARITRDSSRPFGGIQLVLVGDFFQLPPVPQDGLAVFAFDALTWRVCVPNAVRLKQVFRQKDNIFIHVLNQMRTGQLDTNAKRILFGLKREIVYDDGIVSELFPKKDQVESANQERLAALTGSAHEFDAEDICGVDDLFQKISPEKCARLLRDSRAVEQLTLKVGAVVMLVQNLPDGILVNGSLGKVVDFQTFRQAASKCLETNQPKDEDHPSALKKARITSAEGKYGADEEKKVVTEDGSLVMTEITEPSKQLDNERLWPVVEFTTGRKMLMAPMDFAVQRFANDALITEANRRQVPLIMAWAMSIHKSQGQTLSRVKIDLGKAFEKGQAYVAVSRCTSLETLQIINFLPSKVIAHPKVINWSKTSGFSDDPADEADGGSSWKGRIVYLGGEVIIRF